MQRNEADDCNAKRKCDGREVRPISDRLAQQLGDNHFTAYEGCEHPYQQVFDQVAGAGAAGKLERGQAQRGTERKPESWIDDDLPFRATHGWASVTGSRVTD